MVAATSRGGRPAGLASFIATLVVKSACCFGSVGGANSTPPAGTGSPAASRAAWTAATSWSRITAGSLSARSPALVAGRVRRIVVVANPPSRVVSARVIAVQTGREGAVSSFAGRGRVTDTEHATQREQRVDDAGTRSGLGTVHHALDRLVAERRLDDAALVLDVPGLGRQVLRAGRRPLRDDERGLLTRPPGLYLEPADDSDDASLVAELMMTLGELGLRTDLIDVGRSEIGRARMGES